MNENTVPADRDFVLNWKAVADTTPQAALFRENLDADEYALLMVLPPDQQKELILKREIIFVIDTSGSMAGTSIMQAKSALQLALSRLKTGDRFNIIQFNYFLFIILTYFSNINFTYIFYCFIIKYIPISFKNCW